MKQFRKRPVEIEAMQWDGTSEDATRIIDWILGHGSTATYSCSNPDRCAETDGDTPHSINIRTLEGVMRADLGDWIIREPFPTDDRKFYPCKPDIFEKTYGPAVQQPVPAALSSLAERWEQMADQGAATVGHFEGPTSATLNIEVAERGNTYRQAAADVREVLRTGCIPHDLLAGSEPAAPSVPADADLRDRVVRALDAAFASFDPERTEDAELAGHLADAVLAVLPEPRRPFDAQAGLQRLADDLQRGKPTADSPAPGESYRHYKGGLYTVLAVAEDTGTGAPVVVYHDEQQHHWTRPLAEFAGTVADGVQRFTLEGEPAALPAPAVRATLKPMFEGLARLLATSSRDWGTYRVDAWLYAVLVGWDCEQTEHDEACVHGAMEEMAERHGWDADTVAKARRYRAAVRRTADEARQPTGRCTCPHAADEHSIYGCADGCACEWMPKRTPMDPVHILGIDSEDPEGSAALRARLLSRPTPAVRADEAQQPVESPEDRCAECGHWRGVHQPGDDPVTPGVCTVCDEDDARHDYEPTAEAQKPVRPEVFGPDVVAYRHPTKPRAYLCRQHGDGKPGLIPLDSDDLEDGGLCTECGVDVLIPQQQAGEGR